MLNRRCCWFFGLVVAVLVALGLIVLSSAGTVNGARLMHDQHFFLKRQACYLAVGLVVAFFAARIDYHIWRRTPVLTAGLFMLVMVLVCAVFAWPKVNGSHRWIPLGFVRLQPGELAKFTVVIVLAAWIDKIGCQVETFKKGVLVPTVLIGCLALPVLLAPDFGSCMVIVLAGGLVLFLSGAKMLHLLVPGLAGGAIFAWKLYGNSNRMDRLVTFNSGLSNSGADYQVYQAIVAISNGGLTGLGLGESMQKHAYLPEAHTDFIFAVGAEELGLGFTLGVVFLYAAFFAFVVYFARRAADRFGRLLVFGMGFIVFFQSMFNLGVVSRALPTKGMALPFFSYGGTNLVSTLLEVGIILSVAIRSSAPRRRLSHGR